MSWMFAGIALGVSLAVPGAVKPVPPFQEGMQFLGAFEDVPQVMEGMRPLAGWDGREAKLLPIRFGAGANGRKSQWDYPIRCDLLSAGALSLDISVSSVVLTTVRIYLKSGDGGWYAGSLRLPDVAVGRWMRVRLSAETFSAVEGNPLGLGHIDGLRVTFLRPYGGEKFRGTVALANLSAPTGRGNAPLVVGGTDAEPYASRAVRAIRSMGLSVATLPACELTSNALERRPFVVLPYNPNLPDAAANALKAYLAQGGRAVVSSCGVRPDILAALGVRRTGSWYQKAEKGTFRLTGLLPTGSLRASLTGRVDQVSWQTDWLAPVGVGETAAIWSDETGADTGRAALVKTDRGYVFGHVFLKEGLPLLEAIVGELWPEEVTKRAAEREARRKALVDFGKAADEWARSQEGKDGERRLMWCHSPLGLNNDGNWDASVRTLKECGYTDLIANFAWGAGADYPTKVGKMTSVAEKYGDLLEAARAACRQYDVKFHVWLVCWPMSRSLDPAYIAELDGQGRLQYDAAGKRVKTNNTAWLCPSSPENHELLARMMLEFAERGAGGVHFDYIRYPSENACYCAKCRERFEKLLGRPCAAWPKDVRGGGDCREFWQRFRRENVTALVRRVREEMRARFPSVEVSAAVFRDPVGDRESVAQDWGGWLKADLVDFVCPMDYTWNLSGFVDMLYLQKDQVGTTRVYPGIGLTSSARFPPDGGDAMRFSEQALAIRQEGFPGFTCFNFDSRCVKAMKIAREGVLKVMTEKQE